MYKIFEPQPVMNPKFNYYKIAPEQWPVTNYCKLWLDSMIEITYSDYKTVICHN